MTALDRRGSSVPETWSVQGDVQLSRLLRLAENGRLASTQAPPSQLEGAPRRHLPGWRPNGGRGDAVQPGQGHGRTASATRGRALERTVICSISAIDPACPVVGDQGDERVVLRAAISLPIIRSTVSRHRPDRSATPGSTRSSRKRIWVTSGALRSTRRHRATTARQTQAVASRGLHKQRPNIAYATGAQGPGVIGMTLATPVPLARAVGPRCSRRSRRHTA